MRFFKKGFLWWAGALFLATLALATPKEAFGNLLATPQNLGAAEDSRQTVKPGKIRSISMVSTHIGWATDQDGRVLRTVDGGASWYDATPTDLPPVQPATVSTALLSLPGGEKAAWLLDFRDESIYRTIDGGMQWQKSDPIDLAVVNDGSSSLSFSSSQLGWLLVSSGGHNQLGELLRTTDGGKTWRQVTKTGTTGKGLPYGGSITFSPSVNGLGWLRPARGVGAKGTSPLFVTGDSGRTWQPQELPFTSTDQRISSGQVYAQLPQFRGDQGVLPVTLFGSKHNAVRFFSTTNGGSTWQPAGSLKNIGLSEGVVASVLNAQTFWCYDHDTHTLWFTEDGGQTWDSFNPPELHNPEGRVQIEFTSAEEGWALLEDRLLYSSDKGRTWSVVEGATTTNPPAPDTLPQPPSAVHMLDGQNGYGWSPDSPVAITRDAGATWVEATPPALQQSPDSIVTSYFTDVNTGYVFALQPGVAVTVFGTEDGGESWANLAKVPVKYGDGNMSVTFADAQHGWFEERTAGMGQLAGELFATQDGGRTWDKVAESSFEQPDSALGRLPFGGRIVAQKDRTVWLSGGQRAAGNLGGPGFLWLYKSTDGGESWSQVHLPIPEANRQDATAVSPPQFFGSHGVVTVLYTGDSSTMVVCASNDYGDTWQVQGTTPSGSYPVFADPNYGWQTDGQHVYQTEDGGRTWHELGPDVTFRKALSGRYISQLAFTDSQHGWAILADTTGRIGMGVLKTENGGRTWSNP